MKMKSYSLIVIVISVMIACSPKGKVVKMPDLKISLGRLKQGRF